MEPGEYENLVSKAGTGSQQASIELLLAMRLHKVHQPELALVHGGRLLANCPRKLGNDVWTVMEQVFLASCQTGADGWRDYCLSALSKKFPSSTRVERLKGIKAESSGEWPEATRIYNKMLADKPEDTITRKRLVTMHKQRGKISEAIDELNKYLDQFSVDADVWHELAELYVEAGSLSRAVFCFEELMMNNPRSMYHILTYAELLYSTGDFDTCRKYYSLACYLDGTNLRALWGLWAANMALADKDKNKEKMDELQKQTIEKIKAVYKTQAGPKSSHSMLAIAMLDATASTDDTN